LDITERTINDLKTEATIEITQDLIQTIEITEVMIEEIMEEVTDGAVMLEVILIDTRVATMTIK